jgi:hypothetical protein
MIEFKIYFFMKIVVKNVKFQMGWTWKTEEM